MLLGFLLSPSLIAQSPSSPHKLHADPPTTGPVVKPVGNQREGGSTLADAGGRGGLTWQAH